MHLFAYMHITTHDIHYYYFNQFTARCSFIVFTGSSSRCTQAPLNLQGLFTHFFAFSSRPSSQKKFTAVQYSPSPRKNKPSRCTVISA